MGYKMIVSFRHKGLEIFYRTASAKGIQAKHAARLRVMLTVLEHASAPSDMKQPGFRLHPLKGSRHGDWSMTVQANWRLTFRFTGQGVELLNYEDYH